MNKKFLCLVKLVIGLTFVVGASVTALGEEFYKGKTILFIVGFAPGGGFDTYTRTIARHIGKHIPGNPTPIVQNMIGAGTLVSAHYIYSRAKPDGLTVGVWHSVQVLKQALGDRAIKFKGDKFGWIGAPSKGSPTCAIMGFTGLKTLKDVLNSKKPIKMAGTTPGTVFDLPRILNLTSGTRFKVIPGYRGVPRVRIALQRREVDGACWNWGTMRRIARSMLDAKGDDRLIPFLTQGNTGDPEIAHLPQITDVIKGEDNLATFRAWFATYEFLRPLSLPPGTPKERLSILRKAFKATLRDLEFLAQAKKSKLIINYVSGEEIEKLVDQILAISPKTNKSLQFLVVKKKKKKS
jgi:tripartite-type tricarboxylate transporter receptor subunit TctC